MGRLGTSDADRERLVGLLKEALAEELLTKDEFIERVGKGLTARTRGEVDRVRADIVIVAYTTRAWTKIRTPEGKPAFRNWAEFCKLGVGVTEDFPIRGAARRSVVQALRSLWEPAEITDIASATGYVGRTIARDVVKLGLANPNRSNAQKQPGKGLEIAEEKAAAEKVNAALTGISMAELAAYVRAEVPPAEFANLLGGEYVTAMLSK